MSNKAELLKKIKALADRGVDGERESAQTLLARLMEQYGISETELEEERRETAWFPYSQETERRLLNQIIYMVTGAGGFGCVGTYSGRKRKKMGTECTAAICKKNKQVVLFNRYSDSGTISQYIGDGSAVYPISGLPELDEESILTIFDVPEKQREDWLVRYRDIPEGISFEDTDATEKIIEQGNLSIVYSGKTLKPLQTRRGLVFIESRYLSPVSDVLDVLELYERVTPFGAPYIVAKAGFLLQAVIMPCDVISAQFVQRLQELTRQCAVSLDLREQERERQAAADTAGQFKVDPETGAIIEPESEAGA